jgi:hypothetical protein
METAQLQQAAELAQEQTQAMYTMAIIQVIAIIVIVITLLGIARILSRLADAVEEININKSHDKEHEKESLWDRAQADLRLAEEAKSSAEPVEAEAATILILCPGCGKEMKVFANFEGKKGVCPACKKVFYVCRKPRTQ